MNTKLIVTLTLGRDLYPSEKHMFEFPRACCVCHESDPKALINCSSCGNTSFCKDHVSNSNHEYLCSSFFSCFSFDLLKQFTSRMTISEIVLALLNSDAMDFIPPSDKIIKSPSSMRKFLNTYFKKVVDSRRKKSRPEYWNMFISEYFSRPLTLFSAMKKINFVPTSDLVVHVLGANYLELTDASAWEIILHWIPNIQRLKIVLIGPELPNERLYPELCACCNGKKKSITVEVHEAYYHNYMKKGYSKPNLVIGYNIGIAEFENPGAPEDTWKPTILSLRNNESPFILTAYTEEEAKKDHERLRLFLGNKTNFSCFEKNKFASLKPLRDFETEGIFFQNNYMIVYNNLQNMKSENVEEMRLVLKPISKANLEGQKGTLNYSSWENIQYSAPVRKKNRFERLKENRNKMFLLCRDKETVSTPTFKEKNKPWRSIFSQDKEFRALLEKINGSPYTGENKSAPSDSAL